MLAIFKYALVLCLAALTCLLVFEAELPKVDYAEGSQPRVAEQESDVQTCVRAYKGVTSWDDQDWGGEPVVLCTSGGTSQ